MKTTTRIMFNARKVPGGATAAIAAADCESNVVDIHENEFLNKTYVIALFNEQDQRISILMNLLSRYDADFHELVRDVYSEDELLTARLIMLHPNRETEISGGPKHGTDYDLTGACKQCGTGAMQVGPLIVGGEEVMSLRSAKAAQTFLGHILVRQEVALALSDFGTTGLDLRLVFESTGNFQRRLPWRQILACRTLPPMSPATTGLIRDEVCSSCQRNGFFETAKKPMRIVYREADLLGSQDVNLTWESFGYSKLEASLRSSLLARPAVLVSPKVVRILMDCGITAFDFIPIRGEPNRPNTET